MQDDYYQLARDLKGKSRQELASELRKIHQQTLDQMVERVLNILGQGEFENWSIGRIRENVRAIELSGIQLANDRTHLKRCEAVLFVLRERKALIVSKRDVARAFDRGDGVEVSSFNESTLEINPHAGKFDGK